jgi:phage-related baseplate assembly protein
MSRFDAIDLSKLTAPNVIETLDYEAILTALRDDLVEKFPAIEGVIDLESEPARKLLEVFAYRELGLRARVNDAARAVMLAFSGGSDLDHLGALYSVARLEGETDDRFRRRVQLAPEAFSTTGPRGAYVFHALSYSTQIRDVTVERTRPGMVRVSIMMEGAQPRPTPDVVEAIRRKLNEEEVRPLTDVVRVVPCQVFETPIDVRLTLFNGPDGASVRNAALAKLNALIERVRYLGHDLKRSAINAAVFVDGVQDVVIAEPVADLEIDSNAVFHVTSTAVTVSGRDV